MANPEHLEILRKGVKEWNEWRAMNPNDRCDLKREDLRQVNLAGADLSLVSFDGSNLSDAELSHADLSWADLYGANLSGANLSHANLSSSVLSYVDFSKANLFSAEFGDAELQGANLADAKAENANLCAVKLTDAKLFRTDFTRATLGHAELSRAKLCDAKLIGADLSWGKLDGADLSGAKLLEADLRHADLSNTNLTNTDFCNANLESADLRKANLAATKLRKTNLYRSVFGQLTIANVDISEANGLEEVMHSAPSIISVETFYKSRGNIPAQFLRGTGVPEGFIADMLPLFRRGSDIQLYSCFISYSGKDEEFARRLHERMRAAGLRVWFAPEDLKGGDKLLDQLERAIQLYDRLLIVLSDHSIMSDWVMTEIRRARDAERKENRRKLFPIRLTDYKTLEEWRCPDSKGGDLADEVRNYFIPDFSNWKNHDAFEKAFERLLRDLKAEETTNCS